MRSSWIPNLRYKSYESKAGIWLVMILFIHLVQNPISNQIQLNFHQKRTRKISIKKIRYVGDDVLRFLIVFQFIDVRETSGIFGIGNNLIDD